MFCRKPENQHLGAVLVDWLLLQSIIQRLLRFGMCGWRRTALMLYAFRVICETVEQAGDTLFHPLRWRCTTEPAQHFLGFRLFRKLWLVGAFFVCCDELILIYELGISFFSGIARVRQNTGDHIFIPEPSLVIWNILLAKCLGQLIQ